MLSSSGTTQELARRQRPEETSKRRMIRRFCRQACRRRDLGRAVRGRAGGAPQPRRRSHVTANAHSIGARARVLAPVILAAAQSAWHEARPHLGGDHQGARQQAAAHVQPVTGSDAPAAGQASGVRRAQAASGLGPERPAEMRGNGPDRQGGTEQGQTPMSCRTGPTTPTVPGIPPHQPTHTCRTSPPAECPSGVALPAPPAPAPRPQWRGARSSAPPPPAPPHRQGRSSAAQEMARQGVRRLGKEWGGRGGGRALPSERRRRMKGAENCQAAQRPSGAAPTW